jgi:hypothetical protein
MLFLSDFAPLAWLIIEIVAAISAMLAFVPTLLLWPKIKRMNPDKLGAALVIICKDFVEQNGGNLEISSEPGQGSTFSFTLPVS